jgi:hypothetical protein
VDATKDSVIQHFAFAKQMKNPRKEAVEKVEKFLKIFQKMQNEKPGHRPHYPTRHLSGVT